MGVRFWAENVQCLWNGARLDQGHYHGLIGNHILQYVSKFTEALCGSPCDSIAFLFSLSLSDPVLQKYRNSKLSWNFDGLGVFTGQIPCLSPPANSVDALCVKSLLFICYLSVTVVCSPSTACVYLSAILLHMVCHNVLLAVWWLYPLVTWVCSVL